MKQGTWEAMNNVTCRLGEVDLQGDNDFVQMVEDIDRGLPYDEDMSEQTMALLVVLFRRQKQ